MGLSVCCPGDLDVRDKFRNFGVFSIDLSKFSISQFEFVVFFGIVTRFGNKERLQLRMHKPAHTVLLQRVDPLAYQSTYPSTPYLDGAEVPIGLRFAPETIRQVLEDSRLFDASQVESWSEEVITPFGMDWIIKVATSKGLFHVGVYFGDTLVAVPELSPEDRAERNFEGGMGEMAIFENWTYEINGAHVSPELATERPPRCISSVPTKVELWKLCGWESHPAYPPNVDVDEKWRTNDVSWICFGLVGGLAR